MNDLRSRSRTLAPVRTLGPRTGEILSAPPGQNGGKKRKGKKPNPLFQGTRPDLDARKRHLSSESDGDGEEALDADTTIDSRPDRVADTNGLNTGGDTVSDPESDDPLTFQVSRQLRSMAVTALPERDEGVEATAELAADDDPENPGPPSRPTRRREVVDEDEAEEDKFPWHHQFADDEPQELQAKSPLLSRAFRSSVG